MADIDPAVMRLRAENARLRAEIAESHIVCARLTGWTEDHGGVELVLAGGRRIALALEAPHERSDLALEAARHARLGPGATVGKLPNRLFARMMDGKEHRVSELCREHPEATRKQIYNALGYLHRRGNVEQLEYGRYRVVPKDDLVRAVLASPSKAERSNVE